MLVEFEDLGGYGTCDPCTIGRKVVQHNPILVSLLARDLSLRKRGLVLFKKDLELCFQGLEL